MMVHGGGHACIDFHAPCIVGAAILIESRPVFEVRPSREFCLGRNQPKFDSATMPSFAQRRPAFVIPAPITINEFARRLQGDVVGLEGKVEKKWLLAPLILTQIVDRFVDIELRGVELLRHARFTSVLEPVNLVGQSEIALRGLPVVRSAVGLYERAVEASSRWQIVCRLADVPLADRVGSVARLLQARTHRDHFGLEHGQVSRFAEMAGGHGLAHGADAGQMTVEPGQQHGPSG